MKQECGTGLYDYFCDICGGYLGTADKYMELHRSQTECLSVLAKMVEVLEKTATVLDPMCACGKTRSQH